MTPMLELRRIDEVVVCGDLTLRLRFDDGLVKRVDVAPLLRGPIFEPLRAPEAFAEVSLDTEAGTIVWPNGADLAPEALYALPDLGPGSGG